MVNGRWIKFKWMSSLPFKEKFQRFALVLLLLFIGNESLQCQQCCQGKLGCQIIKLLNISMMYDYVSQCLFVSCNIKNPLAYMDNPFISLFLSAHIWRSRSLMLLIIQNFPITTLSELLERLPSRH